MRRAAVAALIASIAVVLGTVPPAGAQDGEDRGATIAFDVGDFDAEIGDWTIDAVMVAGQITPGEPVTVELVDDDDQVLWTGTAEFTEPSTRIEVDRVVAVGAVAGTQLSQDLPVEVAGDVTEADVLTETAGGGGSGELALSLVLAMFFLAILFRTPLPSAATQRWTK